MTFPTLPGPDLDDRPRRPSTSETVDAAAVRLGISPGDVEALRRSLGAKPAEIRTVRETDDGLVVDVDGVAMVFREADRPDANGATGWLLLDRPPTPSLSLAVFSRPAPSVEVSEEVHDGAA